MSTDSKKRDVALVVDDSPETLRLLTDALDGAGMTVMVALDGAAAMRIVDQITPDIILLDAVMPGIDGFETARRLKAAHQALPIILLTSLGEPTAGAPTDADAYLAKPFDRRKLEACIAAVMGRTGR